jgi:hypothetical protein
MARLIPGETSPPKATSGMGVELTGMVSVETLA